MYIEYIYNKFCKYLYLGCLIIKNLLHQIQTKQARRNRLHSVTYPYINIRRAEGNVDFLESDCIPEAVCGFESKNQI